MLARTALAAFDPARRARTVPIVALVVVAGVYGALRGGYTDLYVYQYAGRAVLDGAPVYESRDPVMQLPFTYPPFAAVLMVPLAVVPDWLAAAVWTSLSMAALAAVVILVRGAFGRRTSGLLAVCVSLAALAMEPVWQNLTFGQVNVMLMLAVLVDLLRPERRSAGVLLGIAAGIKLTPLVFVVLLVMVGRRAAAARALVTCAATIAIGFVAMPGSSLTYWNDGLVDPGRVGPPALAHNQSVYGALTRWLDEPPALAWWLALAVPLALAVLLVAAGWWRRGHRVLGTCLGAMAMLLASPVSWSHHWVWVVPVGLCLWESSRWGAVTWVALFVARPILWPPWGEGREYGWSAWQHGIGNAYLASALALVGWAAARFVTDSRDAREAPEARARDAERRHQPPFEPHMLSLMPACHRSRRSLPARSRNSRRSILRW